MDATKIKPNDIAIILRPDAEEGKAFEGTFEILIAGYGPFSMSEDEVRSLVSIAMMMASTISLMEEDEKFTEKRLIRQLLQLVQISLSVLMTGWQPLLRTAS